MSEYSFRIALLSLTLAAGAACEELRRLSVPGRPTGPSGAPPPASGPNTTVRRISIGDAVTATLRGSDPYCGHLEYDGTAPCERFSIAASETGTLVILVTWENPAHYFWIVDSQALLNTGGISCCSSPLTQRIAVAPGGTYEFEVWFVGARYGPGGHTPRTAEQPFELRTAFEPD